MKRAVAPLGGLVAGIILASLGHLLYSAWTKPYDGPEKIWATDVVAVTELTPTPHEADRSDLEFVSFRRLPDIKYGDHDRHVLDLYLPTESVKTPYPVVLFVHGSGLARATKGSSPNDWTVPLLQQGIAIAQVEYRPIKSTKIEFTYPAQIDDCKAALRFISMNSKEYEIDSQRIGLMGESFGGHIAATVGMSADADATANVQVNATCVISGMTDFTSYKYEAAHHRQSLGIAWPALDATIRAYVEPMRQQDPEAPRMASAVTHVHPKASPFYLIYGFSDPVVPPQQGNRLYTQLRNAGVDVQLAIIPGAGHGGPALCNSSTRRNVKEFFTRTLQ